MLQNAIRRDVTIPPRFKLGLADIARSLDCPVVVASYSDAASLRNHATFGLGMGVNWSEFAAAVDLACNKGATIIPNIACHETLSAWATTLLADDIRFFAGIPLCDFDGWRVGSIAVLANSKKVARQGVAIRRLGELGREFVGLTA